MEGSSDKAIECLEKATELDAQNTDARELLSEAIEERKEDNYVPVQAEKDRFVTMFDWMTEGGSDFKKLKMRYYGPDYRGVHASTAIKKGETILYVPKD